MAKKAKTGADGGRLGEIAEGLGTLLGNAEKQWRAWQGPRDAVVKAVTDVRDRAAALLSEMASDFDKGSKKGKKKDKKAKDKKAKGKKAKGEKAKAAKAGTGAIAEPMGKKDQKKAGKKKRAKRAKAATPAPPAPAPATPETGDTAES